MSKCTCGSSLSGSATSHVADALAAADKLAAAGRPLDAVELLTDANRRERDDRIELRLVRLRNEAYAELDRSPTPSPWPDDAARPREGDETLPPIDAGELAPATVRDSILRYGCAYVPGLIPKEDVDRLVEGIDHAFEGCDQQAARGWSRETAGDDPAADMATRALVLPVRGRRRSADQGRDAQVRARGRRCLDQSSRPG